MKSPTAQSRAGHLLTGTEEKGSGLVTVQPGKTD